MSYSMRNMTVKEIKEILATKTKTVIIPTGVVEQHGYHLPLITDILNVEKPIEFAGDKLNAVIAPTVNYCFSGGTLTGTINVSPNTFGLYISEICAEFARIGFENIIVLLGHAGTDNKAALSNSLQMLLRRNPELNEKITLSMVQVWDLSKTWLDGFAMEPEHDFHAGMAETALMKYVAPEVVRDEIVMDDEYTARMMRSDQDWFEKRTKPFDSPYLVEMVGQRDEIEVGVMGFPELATVEMGKKITDEIVENLVAYVDQLEEFRKNK